MKYVGPKYIETDGILLPYMSNILYPAAMTDADISNLLAIEPRLSLYFDPNATNPNGTGSGGSGNNGSEEYQSCCTQLYNELVLTGNEIKKIAFL